MSGEQIEMSIEDPNISDHMIAKMRRQAEIERDCARLNTGMNSYGGLRALAGSDLEVAMNVVKQVLRDNGPLCMRRLTELTDGPAEILYRAVRCLRTDGKVYVSGKTEPRRIQGEDLDFEIYRLTRHA